MSASPIAPAARISLGGIDFLLSAGELSLRLDDDQAYRSFFCPAPADAVRPEPLRVVRVQHIVTPAPVFEGETIFESSATWSLLARDSERALAFRHPDGAMLFVAHFRPGSSDVILQCAPRLLVDGGRVLASPFHYPLDQILTMYLLAGSGVVIHAAGALVGETGLAFAGVSGAGKSTLTGLAAGRADWIALSDDRVIVTTRGERPTLHGTPWTGEGRAAENRRGRLAGLFFLEQGPVNEVRQLAPKDALARLLRTTSVPWYDAEYLGGILDACGRVVSGVPAGVLTFRQDTGAIDAVERFLGRVGGSSVLDPP